MKIKLIIISILLINNFSIVVSNNDCTAAIEAYIKQIKSKEEIEAYIKQQKCYESTDTYYKNILKINGSILGFLLGNAIVHMITQSNSEPKLIVTALSAAIGFVTGEELGHIAARKNTIYQCGKPIILSKENQEEANSQLKKEKE